MVTGAADATVFNGSLNSDRVLQSPHRLRAKCGRQKFPCARPRNRAHRRVGEAIPRDHFAQLLRLAPQVRRFCPRAAKPSAAWCPEADECLRWAWSNGATSCDTLSNLLSLIADN